MPKLVLNSLPEVFVSNQSISATVSEAVSRGTLRKLASRLYTSNLSEAPEQLVMRHWYELITAYFPDALIVDRTAIENRPAADGSIFIISKKTRAVRLPGLILRPRKGPSATDSDTTFIGGARLASTARAYLENMRPSRMSRDGLVSRTLTRVEMEERLETLLRRNGEEALNRLRDEARTSALELDLEKEFERLSELIGTLLGTRKSHVVTPTAQARVSGYPYDPDRILMFQRLFAELREYHAAPRRAAERSSQAKANLAFFEAYFSNFIEGTEFSVEEAEAIVFKGVIPTERPADAHDVLGTYRIITQASEMAKPLADVNEFLSVLKAKHAAIMESRQDKGPGVFKSTINQAGNTIFVAPELVVGTLAKGYELLEGLVGPFQRAVFMMVLVSEVHPFADGNGRVARVMMNAELMRANEERIIIATAYRTDYLGALKALSHNQVFTPVVRMLDYAQRYTASVDWSDLQQVRQTLTATGAFEQGEYARLILP
jgi:hypothetical protein